jgi:hypothetical protein
MRDVVVALVAENADPSNSLRMRGRTGVLKAKAKEDFYFGCEIGAGSSRLERRFLHRASLRVLAARAGWESKGNCAGRTDLLKAEAGGSLVHVRGDMDWASCRGANSSRRAFLIFRAAHSGHTSVDQDCMFVFHPCSFAISRTCAAELVERLRKSSLQRSQQIE